MVAWIRVEAIEMLISGWTLDILWIYIHQDLLMNWTYSGEEAGNDFKVFHLSNWKDGAGIYQMKKAKIRTGREQFMLSLEWLLDFWVQPFNRKWSI